MAGDISGIDALFDQGHKCCRCSASLAGRSRKVRYCEPCKRLARIEKDQRKRVKQKERGYVRRTPVERVCEWCSKSFFPKQAAYSRFCSRECSFAKQKAEAKGRAPKPPSGSCKVFFPSCAYCEQIYTARVPNARYCTNECGTKAYEAKALEQRKAAHPGKIECTCRECGKGFIAEYGNKRRAFCSDDCSKRSVKRIWRKKERARLRLAHVEAVDPTEVFDRDKWRCQECGVRTPRKLRGTYDDRAPELDHIIPLSQGGEHSYRNTQCLCRACNGMKSNNIKGQLRLFG